MTDARPIDIILPPLEGDWLNETYPQRNKAKFSSNAIGIVDPSIVIDDFKWVTIKGRPTNIGGAGGGGGTAGKQIPAYQGADAATKKKLDAIQGLMSAERSGKGVKEARTKASGAGASSAEINSIKESKGKDARLDSGNSIFDKPSKKESSTQVDKKDMHPDVADGFTKKTPINHDEVKMSSEDRKSMNESISKLDKNSTPSEIFDARDSWLAKTSIDEDDSLKIEGLIRRGTVTSDSTKQLSMMENVSQGRPKFTGLDPKYVAPDKDGVQVKFARKGQTPTTGQVKAYEHWKEYSGAAYEKKTGKTEVEMFRGVHGDYADKLRAKDKKSGGSPIKIAVAANHSETSSRDVAKGFATRKFGETSKEKKSAGVVLSRKIKVKGNILDSHLTNPAFDNMFGEFKEHVTVNPTQVSYKVIDKNLEFQEQDEEVGNIDSDPENDGWLIIYRKELLKRKRKHKETPIGIVFPSIVIDMFNIRPAVPRGMRREAKDNSDMTCCMCNEEGKPIFLHHIDNDHNSHSLDNLIVLCSSCHDKVHKRNGNTEDITADQLKEYREIWEYSVKEKRQRKFDEISIDTPNIDIS